MLQFNDDLSVRPELAESFESNSDATEFTFHLRKGVTWHDGKDFDADDVVYSMNRHLGEDSVSRATGLVAAINEWKKIDSYTVRAILGKPNVDLPKVLATFHFRIVQNEAENQSDYFYRATGTGPFIVKEFRPGVRSVSRRNENYWRDGPWVDEVEMSAITDPVARVNALVSGDIQMAATIEPRYQKQVMQAQSVSLCTTPSGAYSGIVMMSDRNPGNNPDFVLAVKLLQDRERMVRSIINGNGERGNDHPIGPAYGIDHCEDIEIRPLDLDKAKFHLKRSGITECEVHGTDGVTGGIEPMLMLKEAAAKAGLTVNVKREPYDGYWGNVWMQKPIHQTNWNMRPTASIMLEFAYHPEAPWNESVWKNERMGMLLESSRSAVDSGQRKELLCEMQRLVRDDAGTAIPFHTDYVDGISDHVKDKPRVPLGPLGGGEWPEFVWLDS